MFLQSPNTHLRGNGCRVCGLQATHDTKRATIDEFLSKTQKVHGSRYNYSLVDYRSAAAHVDILYPVHGVFRMTPNNHLRGQGCRSCSKAGTSRAEVAWLDALGIIQRQVRLSPNIVVDGYDQTTKTAYEFLGDFWHGNPEVHPSTAVNSVVGQTFGALHRKTEARFSRLVALGHGVVYIWEKDWRNGLTRSGVVTTTSTREARPPEPQFLCGP